MHREHVRADVGGRLQDGQAVPAGGVRDVLPRADRARRGELGDDVAEHVVGDGEQQQVAGAADGGGLASRDARQQRLDAGAGGVRVTGDGHDLVTCGAEGRGEHGTDAAGPDDTDAGAGGDAGGVTEGT